VAAAGIAAAEGMSKVMTTFFFFHHAIWSSGPRSRRPPGVRLVVSGISRDTSWQVRIFFLVLDF
jgi:hypothetical protein